MAKIAVLGNGSWGSVLGSMLADNGNDVVLYGNIDSVNQEINEHHTNTHYMKNWKLNPNVPATGDLEKALDGAEIVLFVLPTKAVRIVAKNVRKILEESKTDIRYEKIEYAFEDEAQRFIEVNSERYAYIDNEAQAFIRDVASKYEHEQIVLSFSGGKDSTVTADLVVRALSDSSLVHIFGDTTLEFPMTMEYSRRFREIWFNTRRFI